MSINQNGPIHSNFKFLLALQMALNLILMRRRMSFTNQPASHQPTQPTSPTQSVVRPRDATLQCRRKHPTNVPGERRGGGAAASFQLGLPVSQSVCSVRCVEGWAGSEQPPRGNDNNRRERVWLIYLKFERGVEV